jgi:FXSXX-COOH protein
MSEGAQLNLDGDVHFMIADVAEIPLEILLDSDDSALGNSVRRILREIKTQGEHYAAHSTAL